MIYQGTARYPVTEIILHCADTRPDWMAGHPLVEKVAEIRRWHVQQRGWRDIGYHWGHRSGWDCRPWTPRDRNWGAC